jgi:hypothetical protein
VFQEQPREILSQGDVFTRIRVAEVVDEEVQEHVVDLVVLSHECEIAKPGNSIVLCARIRTITSLDPANVGNVRSGRVLNAMHIPAVGSIAEGFVDFRWIHRIPKEALLRAMQQGDRVGSMLDDGRLALVTHVYRYFARKLPNSEGEATP